MNFNVSDNKVHYKFWISFFVLNSLFFVTRYLFDSSDSPFFPFKYFFEGDIFTRFKVIFIRPGYDIFRLNVELVLLTTALLLFGTRIKRTTVFIATFWIVYLFLFFYSIYHGAIEGIYQTDPLFFNDLTLLQTGFSIIRNESAWVLTVINLILVLMFWTTFKMSKMLFYSSLKIKFGKLEKVVWSVLVILVVLNTKYGLNVNTRNAIQPVTVFIYNNINRSDQASKALADFNIEKLSDKIPYKSYELKDKPNIYILAIESYGSVVLNDDSTKSSIVSNLKIVQNEFIKAGWNNASALSVSPSFGGKSWVSYSSILYGFNFKNQGTYDALFNTPELYDYPSWPNVFRSYGYKSIRLNSLPPADLVDVPWEQYSKFYNIDKWIKFEDLDFNGKSYGFGPAPPDQYSFNKAMELIKDEQQPIFFFFLNQNTHHPYESPKNAMSNWKESNKSDEKQVDGGIGFLGTPNKNNYINSINYQLDYISQYILNNADSTDIFILIGDHQPPFVSDPKDGMSCPVHIISKNNKLIDNLITNGFMSGMIPQNTSEFHHAGIYSVFMNSIIGLDSTVTNLPKTYPLGVE